MWNVGVEKREEEGGRGRKREVLKLEIREKELSERRKGKDGERGDGMILTESASLAMRGNSSTRRGNFLVNLM